MPRVRTARAPCTSSRLPTAGTGALGLEEVEPTGNPLVVRRDHFRLRTGAAETLLQPGIAADEVQLANLVLEESVILAGLIVRWNAVADSVAGCFAVGRCENQFFDRRARHPK